jgi:hypothetical protein
MSVIPFPSPPAGFDIATASDESLSMFGFPFRPDAVALPGRRASWDRAFGRKLSFLKAEVAENAALKISAPYGPPIRPWPIRLYPFPTALQATWAGLMVDARGQFGSDADMVYAEWAVPTIQPAPPAVGTLLFFVGAWNGSLFCASAA